MEAGCETRSLHVTSQGLGTWKHAEAKYVRILEAELAVESCRPCAYGQARKMALMTASTLSGSTQARYLLF